MSETTLAADEILITSAVPSHPGVAAALVAAQAEFGVVAKGANNPFFKSKYADLPAIIAEASPVLARHGLAISQEPGFEYFIAGDKTTVLDTLSTVLLHESGETYRSTMIIRPVKNDPQAQGSAITYARRYAYMAVLGLVADVDDDGNAASGRGKPAAARTTRAKPSGGDGDSLGDPEVANLLGRIKAAAKATGNNPTAVQAVFASDFDGEGNVINSTDKVKLKQVAEHFEGIANASAIGSQVSE